MMDLFMSSAYAEGTAAAAQPNPMMSLMPFFLIFGVFYFLMIRPQKKKLEEEKALMGGLTKGDEIFTKSGIIGVIQGVTDKVITLEIADGVKLKMLKSQIGGMAKSLFEKEDKK